MPVVIKRSSSQRLESAKARNDETQGRMEYLENAYSRSIIYPRHIFEVTYGIRQYYSKCDQSGTSHTGVDQRVWWRPEPITSNKVMPFSIPYRTKLSLEEKEEQGPGGCTS